MRSVLVGVFALVTVAALSGSAVAAPSGTVSNVQLLLDDSVLLADAGESVALLGYIHVQTRVDPAKALASVQANVTADFVAYSEDPPSLPDPELSQRLEELKARANQLKSEIVANEATLAQLQQQLLEAGCDIGVLSYLPGADLIAKCPSIGAFLAIAVQLAQQRRLELQAELKAVLDEMKALMAEIQRESEKGTRFEYGASGAFSSVSELVGSETQQTRSFTLTDALGVRRSFTVRLSLSFSPAGSYRSGGVQLACEATGVCFPDSGT